MVVKVNRLLRMHKKVTTGTPMEQVQSSFFYSAADVNNNEEMHIILPLDKLLRCIHQSFVCNQCGKASSWVVEHVRIGIATSLNFFDDCGKISSMKAGLQKNEVDRNYDEDYSRKCVLASGMSVAWFDMNNRLVLAMQETGGGQAEAVVTGGLDLCLDAMLHTPSLWWKKKSVFRNVNLVKNT
jgi:hypothetical protein